MTWVRTLATGLITLCCCPHGAFANQISPDALDKLPVADIYWLGEVHDNPEHHTNQARAITALRPAAIVMEMLTDAQVAAVAGMARTDQAALAAALDWESSGWPDFALYFPLFTATDAKLYPAALTRDEARGIFGRDPALAFGSDAERFGLTTPFTAQVQAKQLELQDKAHCNAMPAEMLPAMVNIQRLRDARLAQAAARAYQETGGPVVVIAGTGHLGRDIGAPAALARAAPALRQLVIGQFEAKPHSPPMDVWIVTAPHPRPDPCAAFR
jgi:uncharacterized iron-regulated protein